MDRARNRLLWLQQMFEAGVINKGTYKRELILFGKREQFLNLEMLDNKTDREIFLED